jgi:hypothetical protein
MAIAVHALHRARPRKWRVGARDRRRGIGAFLAYARTRVRADVAVADLSDDRLEVAAALGARVLLGSARSLTWQARSSTTGLTSGSFTR